jgi:hypothetical protein
MIAAAAAVAGDAVYDERPEQATVDAAEAARERQQPAQLADQVAHEDERDWRRSPSACRHAHRTALSKAQ